MCRDHRLNISLRRRNTQRGFLIPLAAIILVGLAVMAVGIHSLSRQTSTSTVTQGLSVQAFFAAESGGQYALNRLLFDVTDNAVSDANCVAISGTTINFSVPGLRACQAVISCQVSVAVGSTLSFYLIESRGSCGAASLFAERSVEISAYL
ncbi:MAG: MSHA biogenesis protein MshP [Alteromonadaceae bacterium]|nr:MAG: MSHA biogenesis protein MshP [Alteromonadaceae bacterium]